MAETVRVDAWTWAVRLFKTRSEATSAARAGHVRVNGTRVKPAQQIRIGDTVQARAGGVERTLVAKQLITKRVGAAIAAECFTDLTPPPPPREERVLTATRERGLGRPTKRDRREIERFRGRIDTGE